MTGKGKEKAPTLERSTNMVEREVEWVGEFVFESEQASQAGQYNGTITSSQIIKQIGFSELTYDYVRISYPSSLRLFSSFLTCVV